MKNVEKQFGVPSKIKSGQNCLKWRELWSKNENFFNPLIWGGGGFRVIACADTVARTPVGMRQYLYNANIWKILLKGENLNVSIGLFDLSECLENNIFTFWILFWAVENYRCTFALLPSQTFGFSFIVKEN
jgi:hypothetical protein